MLRLDLFLKVVKEAELAPAVTSRGMEKVPTTHLLKVISGREKVVVAGRVGISIGEGKVRCEAIDKAAVLRRAGHDKQACTHRKRVPK
jgi:hypothetical protein